MPFIDTEPFNHSGLSLCIPDVAVTLYAFVECDSDLDTVGDTWIPVAQHQVVVYPEIQIPTLVGPDVDDTGDCTYTILPACTGDVLDVDATFTLPPSSTSDTITVGVTSGLVANPCNAPVTFDLAYTDCPNANCVGTDFDAASAITEFLCSGEVVTLPTFNLTGNLSTAVGNPMWYEGDPEDGNVFVEDPQFHSGVDNCLPDAPVNINAYVECDTDGDDIGDEWIPLASHTFQVFPEIQAPTLSAVSIDADGNCTYTIETNCDTDVLSIVETITLAPGEAAGTADGTITSDVPNNPCPSVDFSLPYDTCSDVDCPNLVTTAPIDALCNNGGTIDLADLQDAGIVDGTWTVVNNLGDDIPLTGFAGTVFDALGLDPGDYTATYTPTDIPPASCPPNTSETITVVGNPTITADNDGPVCAGGDIQLNVTSINGASYEWTGPDSFASLEQNPLLTSVATVDAGEYSVTVTLGACTSTASTVVVVNEQPNISISPENSAVCPGSPVTLTVNGFVPGTILDWGGDDVVFDNPDGSVVTVTPSEETNVYTCVATAGDCESTATATVSVTDQLEVLVTPSAEGFCESTEYYLVLSGATEYDLLNFNGDWEAITADSILINSTDGNTFQIIGNDGGDCESPPTDFTIPVSDEISITMDSELPFGECTVGEVLATATGGTGNLTYSWTPALGLADPADSTILQPNISVDEPTVFTLTVEDDLGCTASASLEAIPSDSFDVIVTTGEDLVLCPGASQTITLSGAETYEWVDTDAHNGETATIIGDIDEPYQEYPIIGYDQYNCTDTLILTVTVSNDLEVEEIPDTSVCLGSSIQLSIPNADTEWIYEWVGPELDDTAAFNPMVSPIEATLYEVTVTDEDGCTNTAEVNVSVNDIPVISPGFNDNNVCFDVPVGLGGAADNAESYLWTGGSGTFVDATSASTSYLPGPNDAGETNLTFTATNVCGSNQNVIAVNILPQQSFAISDDYFEFCEGEPIDLSIQTSTVENYVDYTASEGSFAPTNNEWTLSGGAVTPGTLQDYYLSVETICGNLEDTLTVLVNPTVEVIAPTDTTINIGSSVFLEAEGDTSENYIWTVAESVAEFADLSLSCENCESPEVNPEGTTTYMVTSGEDCATSSTVTINVLTETIALIPNAFSPNGDGRNDLFRIFGSNFELDDVYIFNRYGHLIYEAKDNQGWDGYYEGEAQEIGVYLYMVRYHSTIDGTVENFTGNVTLIR